MVDLEIKLHVNSILTLYLALQETPKEQSGMGAGGVPKGAKTSDYYRTSNIPDRMDNPGMMNF